MTIDSYGIDGSHFQTLTDPAAVHANGITFAAWKCTEGNSFADPTYSSAMSRLKAAGIRVGAYHFASSGNAAAQASYFKSHAGGYLATGNLWPMLDLENTAVQGIADSFICQFYDALGTGCLLVYGNLSWWQNSLHPASWGNRNIRGWIARYNGDPGNPGFVYPGMALHQHSDAGNVPGITTVDRDVIFNGHTLNELTLGQENDMPVTDADAQLIANKVWNQMLGKNTGPFTQVLASTSQLNVWAQTFKTGGIQDTLNAIKAAVGTITDAEAHLLTALQGARDGSFDVQALANALAPLLPENATPDEIADAVRKAFATRLAAQP